MRTWASEVSHETKPRWPRFFTAALSDCEGGEDRIFRREWKIPLLPGVLARGMSMTFRRALRAAIVMIVLALLLAPAALPVDTDCAEPCPEESSESGCQPLCAACTVCAHIQVALTTASTPPLPFPQHRASRPFDLAMPDSSAPDEVFHVPLLV